MGPEMRKLFAWLSMSVCLLLLIYLNWGEADLSDAQLAEPKRCDYIDIESVDLLVALDLSNLGAAYYPGYGLYDDPDSTVYLDEEIDDLGDYDGYDAGQGIGLLEIGLPDAEGYGWP